MVKIPLCACLLLGLFTAQSFVEEYFSRNQTPRRFAEGDSRPDSHHQNASALRHGQRCEPSQSFVHLGVGGDETGGGGGGGQITRQCPRNESKLFEETDDRAAVYSNVSE